MSYTSAKDGKFHTEVLVRSNILECNELHQWKAGKFHTKVQDAQCWMFVISDRMFV